MTQTQTTDFPLAVVDLSILESRDSIQLDEAHTDDVAHIIIKSDGRALGVKAESRAATVAWHTRLQVRCQSRPFFRRLF